MLKYLYKTLVISILCGSILMLDMSYKANTLNLGVNQVKAETLTTGGGSDSAMMSTLTMVAISVIASRLFLYGKVTPDILLAAAGGLAFMAGDIIATNEIKKALNEIQTDIARKGNGDITDNQRQSLIKLRDSYNKVKKTAKTKKDLQTAAAVAFAAAAIVAYMESASEIAAATACSTAIGGTQGLITAGTMACESACSFTCTSACLAAAATCETGVGTAFGLLANYLTIRLTPSLSCAAFPTTNAGRTSSMASNAALAAACPLTFAPVAVAINGACSPLYPIHLGYETGCLSPALQIAGMSASVALMGISTSTIVTLIVGLSTPLATMVDTAIFIPMRRAIMWGVLAGMSYMAANATDGQIQEIEGYISKINALLNPVNNLETGNVTASVINGAQTVNTVNAINTSIETVRDGVDLAGSKTKIPCITMTADPGVCPSYKSRYNALPGIRVPTALSTTIDSIVRTADALNGSSNTSGSTLSAAESLGSQHYAVRAMLDKQRAATQEKLLKANSKINLANEEAKLTKDINNALEKALKDNNLSLKDAYASLGSGAGSDGANSATDASKMASDALKKSNVDIVAPTIVMSKATKNKVEDVKLIDEDATKKAELAAKTETPPTSMDAYDLKNDINSKTGPTLFEVISSRYQKSGYPRLFKRIQE